MTSQEERDIRATMERIKAKVENLMAQMETALGSDPVPTLSLRRRTRNSENVWSEYEGLYDQLRAITKEDQAGVNIMQKGTFRSQAYFSKGTF